MDSALGTRLAKEGEGEGQGEEGRAILHRLLWEDNHELSALGRELAANQRAVELAVRPC